CFEHCLVPDTAVPAFLASVRFHRLALQPRRARLLAFDDPQHNAAVVEDLGVEAGALRRYAVAIAGLAVAILAAKECFARMGLFRGSDGMNRSDQDDRYRDASYPAH